MRCRALLLLALCLSGCFGSGGDPPCPVCAAPTNETANAPPYVKPVVIPDFNDSGYVLNAPWHVGDGWDYYSNQSDYHTVRVLKEANVNGSRLLLVEETERPVGASVPRSRADVWMNGDTLARYNLTYVGGTLSYSYSPSDPSWRYLKNGSFAYNESSTNAGRAAPLVVVRANAQFNGYEKLRLSWGTFTVGHVEQRILRSVVGGDNERQLVLRFPLREYGADGKYRVPSGELYTLVGVKYGDVHAGALIDAS